MVQGIITAYKPLSLEKKNLFLSRKLLLNKVKGCTCCGEPLAILNLEVVLV
jgi:hypothetical protein